MTAVFFSFDPEGLSLDPDPGGAGGKSGTEEQLLGFLLWVSQKVV